MITNEQKMMALNMPHNIMIVDQLINVKVTGFNSFVTLGFTTPGGHVQSAGSFSVPTDVLHQIATEILQQIKASKDVIESEQQSLINKL